MQTPATLEKKPQPVYLKNYQPPEFLIDEVHLEFHLGEVGTEVRAVLKMRRNPSAVNSEEPLRLHGEELELLRLTLNGEALEEGRYKLTDEGLTVEDPPDTFELESLVRIKPQENTRLMGLYKSSGNFCTQCEAEGFRRITYYLDRPDVMARFTTTITGDKNLYPVLLSNGNCVASGELQDGRHWVKWEDPHKKPAYLFALVAGRLECVEDRFTTMSGREVLLQIYVELGNSDKCDHAMLSLKQAMRWDEETYGREYDLDIYMIVAVNDFNMGAMENKGLNVFNSKYVLARPDTATDDDFEGIGGVIAHEYFHNWTGNRVTCRDWFQLSLKEGLTVFRDQMFTADLTSPAIKRISDVNLLRTRQFTEDASPMSHPVRPESYIEMNNFYTMTVYNKGAEVVRMYHSLLGAHGFRKGMDLYFDRHDGQAVTCDDFRAAMADANSRDLDQFERWYQQAGTPVLAIEDRYDLDTQSYFLKVGQSCPDTPGQSDKLPFMLPLEMGLLAANGVDLPTQLEGEGEAQTTGNRVLVLTQKEQEFCFVNVPSKPVPSLLRKFSAPVKLQFQRDRKDLALLMAHDSDAFSCWEAGQEYAMLLLLEQVERIQNGKEPEIEEDFINAFHNNLVQKKEDMSFWAFSLILPNEEYLAEQLDVIDVHAIHRARQFFRHELGRRLAHEFEEIYDAHQSDGAYQFEQAEVGRRRLRNVCLAYLGTLGSPAMIELTAKQFAEADNMTDSLAALSVFNDLDCPEREQAFQAFYEQWQDDTLVLDKWFAMQATSRLPNALDRVKELLDHPAFSIKNPNKVRSLIGAYCMSNPVNFHATDGQGYEFFGDQVIELNGINPQIAARLMGAITRWRRYPKISQELMKTQLRRILDLENLSKDVFEIASKSL